MGINISLSFGIEPVKLTWKTKDHKGWDLCVLLFSSLSPSTPAVLLEQYPRECQGHSRYSRNDFLRTELRFPYREQSVLELHYKGNHFVCTVFVPATLFYLNVFWRFVHVIPCVSSLFLLLVV